MTQTSATNESTAPGDPVFPPGRYGRRRESRRRRWILPVVLVAVIAIMALVSVKLYRQYGTPDFVPTVTKVSGVTDTSVTITFTVSKPSGDAAICTVDAYAYDHSVIGTAEVTVRTGTNVQVQHTIQTTKRAYTADVPSCRSASR